MLENIYSLKQLLIKKENNYCQACILDERLLMNWIFLNLIKKKIINVIHVYVI